MKTFITLIIGLFMSIAVVACAQSSDSQAKKGELDQGQQVQEKNSPKKTVPTQASAKDSKLFPEFKVKDLKGNEVNLSSYKGKVVILDLFATWCPPCRMEIPHFVELQNEYKKELAIIGLSYDQTGPEKVIDFAEKLKINYDLYWGSQEIAAFVGLRGIPHTLVIDKQGQIIHSFVGYRDKSVFEEAIKPLL